jgi:hypothetical protein
MEVKKNTQRDTRYINTSPPTVPGLVEILLNATSEAAENVAMYRQRHCHIEISTRMTSARREGGQKDGEVERGATT